MEQVMMPGVEKKMSRVVLGSMVFSPEKEKASYAILDAFFAAGGSAIDTAHVYASGDSERLIGMWMKQRKNRTKVFLIDKGGHPHANLPRPRLGPEELESDLSESLRRLQTDYVDLYMLHRDDSQIPVGPIIDYLNQQIRTGRIRTIAASNWEHERIQEANDYAGEHGLEGFVVSSANLSLAVPKEPLWKGVLSVGKNARDWHHDRGFPLMPWSSQARGFFGGQFSPEKRDDKNMVRVYYNDDNFERLRRAKALGAQKGFSAIQIALGYVLHQPFPIFPIIGPATLQELESSLGALQIQLSDSEMRWLNLED